MPAPVWRSGHQQALTCARIAHARRCAGVRWMRAWVQLTKPPSRRNLMRSGLMVVKAGPQAGRTLPTLSMNLDNAVQHIRRPDQRWVIEQDAGATPPRCAQTSGGARPRWAPVHQPWLPGAPLNGPTRSGVIQPP